MSSGGGAGGAGDLTGDRPAPATADVDDCTTLEVFLVRHGESLWNAATRGALEASDPMIFDAGLTEKGEEQARSLNMSIADGTSELPAEVDAVVCSPLSRSLRTAVVAGAAPGSGRDVDVPRRIRAPIFVWPCVAEKLEASCDVGSSPAQLREQFPAIAATGAFDDLDGAWWWYDAEALLNKAEKARLERLTGENPELARCDAVAQVVEEGGATLRERLKHDAAAYDWRKHMQELGMVESDREVIERAGDIVAHLRELHRNTGARRIVIFGHREMFSTLIRTVSKTTGIGLDNCGVFRLEVPVADTGEAR